MDNSGQNYLRIENITKTFGDFVALDNVSLTIEQGEFICFLGPSGCGKTTLLRIIAGLEQQTSGHVIQDSVDLSDLPPNQRDFGIVFQSYALFPNLSVEKNIAYGLENLPRKQRPGRKAIKARVDELISTVGLSAHTKKYPAQLSGGQQQRVALARALACEPSLLLLDEPLSALDAKVRQHLRREILSLQRDLGVTTIMVTHDQEEALAMADRIAVMSLGKIEQLGTPQEIYQQPQSPFVAEFIGNINMVQGVKKQDGVSLDCDAGDGAQQVTASIRPEDIVCCLDGQPTADMHEAVIESLEFLGAYYRLHTSIKSLDLSSVMVDVSHQDFVKLDASIGEKLYIRLPEDRLLSFDLKTIDDLAAAKDQGKGVVAA